MFKNNFRRLPPDDNVVNPQQTPLVDLPFEYIAHRLMEICGRFNHPGRNPARGGQQLRSNHGVRFLGIPAQQRSPVALNHI